MIEPNAVNAAAIIPQYVKGVGDGTEIIMKSGKNIIDNRTIRTVINEIAIYYAIDLVRLRRTYGEFLGQRNIIPIAFTESLVLIPLKIRIPRAKNDSAFGYFNLYEIKDVIKDGCISGQTNILLNSGLEVPVLHTCRTVRNHIAQGVRTSERFRMVHRLADRHMTRLENEMEHITRMMKQMMSEIPTSSNRNP